MERMRLNSKYIQLSLFFFIALFLSCTQEKVIKVACIGDSITYGHGIDDLENDSYPARLGKLLGEQYDVRNFGVCGATCLKNGDLSYWDQEMYTDALAFQPDMVVIMLGSNDSKPQNWIYAHEYKMDYLEMFDSFQSLKSNPQIWVCNPPPAFESRWGINDSVISNEIVPVVREVAALKGVHNIDFNAFFSDKAAFFPDRIHPNKDGAQLIAEKVTHALFKN